ncbi:MBL fold metallo-hydrolase [Candidatus Woesearchaeota archaeon]|nr:MBL fold metallo-hydrolase [Candidatus Woesearchaeota archaeon]
MLEIIPVGGYGEVGRNCTLIKWKSESVLVDLGLELDNYIRLTEDNPKDPGFDDVIVSGSVPDILSLSKADLKSLKAVLISHGHLDHVGGVPYFIKKLGVKVHGSSFTMAILKSLLLDKKVDASDFLVSHDANSCFRVSKNIEVEFLPITHSIPQAFVVVVRTPSGSVVYANDFKVDDSPVVGDVFDASVFSRVKDCRVLIIDSLYAGIPGTSGSEQLARKMLFDALLRKSYDDNNILITTFSSHIGRLKTLVELAKKMNRQPVLVGRSLLKYVEAAKSAGVADLLDGVEFVKYGSDVEKYFKIVRDTEKKFFIVTGHQGEPKAVLSRLVFGKLFPFKKNDLVVFSSKVIPSGENEENVRSLERGLRHLGVEVLKELHVSGHAHSEEHKLLISLLKPEFIIPTHGEPDMLEAQKDFCKSLGYDDDKVLLLKNFDRVKF